MIANNDGTYRVVGGNLNDNDHNIYAFSAGKNGELVKTGIGVTTSITSFYDSYANEGEGGWAIGSIIDPNDNSGKNFLDNLVREEPEIGYYMDNAKRGQRYDFKSTNGGNSVIKGIDQYRGMPVGKTKSGQPIYTSAKDIGNIGAGYIAGINAVPWAMARKEFDKLQSAQDKRPGVEKASTQNAERYGWELGRRDMFKAPGMIVIRGIRSLPTLWKRITK